MLGQSPAVHRFAGQAAGLYPSDEVQVALVDACIDACDDVLVRATRCRSWRAPTRLAPAPSRTLCRDPTSSSTLVRACVQVAANGAGRGMELGDKLLARRQACAEGGSLFSATAKVEAHYDRHTPAGSPYLTGSLSMADIAVFCYFGHGVSGFFDGVDPEYLMAFPRIRAVRKAVVELPAVQRYYEAEAGKEHMKLSMGGLDVGAMYQAILKTARAA
jgi:hypothetical protein